MDVRLLKVFLAVVEEGSVTAGARRLFLAQPAVTRHLQALERQLGSPLLRRSSKGVEPTDAGQALAVEARKIVAAADRVSAEARALRGVLLQSKGRIEHYTIGIHDEGLAELTPQVLRAVKTALPGVDIRVRNLDYTSLPTALAEGLADVLLGSVLLATEGCEALPVYADPLLVQVGEHSDRAAAVSLTVADVIDLPMPGPSGPITPFLAPYLLLDKRNGETPPIAGTVHNVRDINMLITTSEAAVHINLGTARLLPGAGTVYVPLVDARPVVHGVVFPEGRRSGLQEVALAAITAAVRQGHLRVPGAIDPAALGGNMRRPPALRAAVASAKSERQPRGR